MKVSGAAVLVVLSTLTHPAAAAVVNTSSSWLSIQPDTDQSGQPIVNVGLTFEANNAGWNTNPNFDDSTWVNSVYEGTNVLDYIWGSDPEDSPVYFRYLFALDQNPSSASLEWGVDDDAQIYINGQLVVNDQDGVATGGTVDVSSWVFSGVNLVAVKAHDSFGLGEAFGARLTAEGANLTPVPVPAAALLFATALGLFGGIGVGRQRQQGFVPASS